MGWINLSVLEKLEQETLTVNLALFSSCCDIEQLLDLCCWIHLLQAVDVTLKVKLETKCVFRLHHKSTVWASVKGGLKVILNACFYQDLWQVHCMSSWWDGFNKTVSNSKRQHFHIKQHSLVSLPLYCGIIFNRFNELLQKSTGRKTGWQMCRFITENCSCHFLFCTSTPLEF